MKVRVVVDKAGRVVIPKPLREELHLEPGDSLELEIDGDQITLRPAQGTGPLQNEHGIWVLHTGEPIPASATDDLLSRMQDERDRANLNPENMQKNPLSSRAKPSPERSEGLDTVEGPL